VIGTTLGSPYTVALEENTIFSTVISSSIYKDIVTDIYNKIQTLDMEYFAGKKIGDMMTRVMTDPGNINSIILEVFNMIPEIIKVIICTVIAFYVDFDLTLGVMIVAPILVVTVRRYAKRLKRSGRDRQEAIDNLNSKLQVITIVGAISSMYTPARRAITRFNTISVNLSSITRVSEILEEIPSIVNKENCVKFENFIDGISFENVDFEYKDNPEKILKNINLDVKKGETVAFVGNSGGGKSTLVNLIPRFFDVSNGSLKIDGIDVRDYEIKSLRKAIGIVPQETFLFSGTILSNIKYSRQDATFEEVVEAAKQANAHEFIENLPDGYDTEIGERGVKLSGGQKQRIAIARAILENPQILILDEATSALDNESEKLVQDALEKLMEGKTTFIIAHRLTTIENSNKIVVIQKGEIKEVGSHNELLSKDGIYKALYNKNFD